MKNEFKRAMKLMWANKRMRKAFGCDFGLRSQGGCLLAIVLFSALPLFEMISGLELRLDTTGIYAWGAFGSLVFIEVMMTQCIYSWYGNVGRGFGAFPMAKCIMTKGFLANLLLYYEVGHLLLLGMRGVCVELGAVEESCFDDILFLSGLIVLLQALVHTLFSKMQPLYASGTEGTSTVVGFCIVMQLFGGVDFSIGWAILWHLALVIVGGFVYYKFMSARYRARSTWVLQGTIEKQ